MNTEIRPMLGTKARTLESLDGRLRHSRILPLHYFTVQAWRQDPGAIMAEIVRKFGDASLIVRSSAISEDTANASMAGHFTSVLDVQKPDNIRNAIESVIESYGESRNMDEVLVQEMLKKVVLSGVAFTHDPSTSAPYRVVNYVTGADTAAVTGGQGLPQTFVAAVGVSEMPPSDISPVIAMLEELEEMFGGRPLDVEFAITAPGNTLYVLQVRPLVLSETPPAREQHQKLLQRVAQKIRVAQQPHPFLSGRSTVFGVMPDWNPAEIIGVRPRPLALSLYRELVTDATWAYQRNNYGYRNLRSFPLVVNFAGQPYIDVRLSFNSFIPKDIEGSLADRLVDYYINRLVDAPTLHDKVEFEVVFSCYTLDLPERLRILDAAGFTVHEQKQLADSLRVLTNRIIDRDNGLWRVDADKITTLSVRREKILSSGLDPVSRIYWLLEDCKRYGTLPFAGLARAGFIAVQMLKSMVAVGVFTPEEYDNFMNGLDSISSQLTRDLATLDRSTFLSRYGHLRPGTYDILSPRYDEAPDDYLGSNRHVDEPLGNRKPFSLSLHQMRTITSLLEEHGLSSDVVGLFDFLQAGIELREYSKFVFTRNLSDALSIFKSWGAELGFSHDDLSFASIRCITELYAGADDPKAVLARSIAEGKERYRDTSQMWLPSLITRPEDVFAFHVPECEPNFITQRYATGHVMHKIDHAKLGGAIVFIPSADPGYDWLFSHPIAGLVTAYGGVNSHMAIRANELGLPAVIGAGESLFGRWSKAERIHIDCAGRRVEILR